MGMAQQFGEWTKSGGRSVGGRSVGRVGRSVCSGSDGGQLEGLR